MVVLCTFYRKIATTWDDLQTEALIILEERAESGEDDDQWIDDYTKAVSMGLKTFIMDVLNLYNTYDYQIFYEKGDFFKAYSGDTYNYLEIEVKDYKKIQTQPRLKSKEETLKFLNSQKGNIKVTSETFDQLYTFWEDIGKGLIELLFVETN